MLAPGIMLSCPSCITGSSTAPLEPAAACKYSGRPDGASRGMAAWLLLCVPAAGEPAAASAEMPAELWLTPAADAGSGAAPVPAVLAARAGATAAAWGAAAGATSSLPSAPSAANSLALLAATAAEAELTTCPVLLCLLAVSAVLLLPVAI
jgi:hypothetical protein